MSFYDSHAMVYSTEYSKYRVAPPSFIIEGTKEVELRESVLESVTPKKQRSEEGETPLALVA